MKLAQKISFGFVTSEYATVGEIEVISVNFTCNSFVTNASNDLKERTVDMLVGMFDFV